ncbi:MAG: hypothetical protein RQ875_11545 [Vicingaceae bacterium]|nr:hypothetical protein [Vicingaceae bacterium]
MRVTRLININNKQEEIELKARRYRIYVLGGIFVNLGEFSISFKHKETNEITECQKAFWPVQTYAFGKKAKRIFIVDIPKEGQFEVIFNNPETLKVNKSNLIISRTLKIPF